jgi:S1/P1 Nuclease
LCEIRTKLNTPVESGVSSCSPQAKEVTIFKKAFTSILLCCSLVPRCHAWGHEGHRLTALIAQDYLTSLAEENVHYLLGKETLSDVASWADEYREDHRETAGWHYVDIPGAQNAYDRVRDCPLPAADPGSRWRDCVVDRILYFEDQLKDPSSDRRQRALALKFLVHLIGDIHQPFHAIDDARGGNNVHVMFFGTTQCGARSFCNLRSVWDDGLLEHRGLSEKKYLALLRSELHENDWEKQPEGDPISLANASHHYAQDAFVPNGAFISSKYYDVEIKIVDQQLVLGGLHLAEVLNGIFSGPPVP